MLSILFNIHLLKDIRLCYFYFQIRFLFLFLSLLTTQDIYSSTLYVRTYSGFIRAQKCPQSMAPCLDSFFLFLYTKSSPQQSLLLNSFY